MVLFDLCALTLPSSSPYLGRRLLTRIENTRRNCVGNLVTNVSVLFRITATGKRLFRARTNFSNFLRSCMSEVDALMRAVPNKGLKEVRGPFPITYLLEIKYAYDVSHTLKKRGSSLTALNFKRTLPRRERGSCR